MSTEQFKSEFLIMVKSRSFGRGPSTALSKDRDYDPCENVKVLASILVMLYLARTLVWRLGVSLQIYWVRLHASDHQVGVQKFDICF